MIRLNREGHGDVIVDRQESSGKTSGCMKLICWMVVAIILLLISLGSMYCSKGFLRPWSQLWCRAEFLNVSYVWEWSLSVVVEHRDQPGF
jgi:hypothetical protein